MATIEVARAELILAVGDSVWVSHEVEADASAEANGLVRIDPPGQK